MLVVIIDVTIGENTPTLKLLNRYVKKEATNKWYDLGIELLSNEDVEELSTIRNNHPIDAGTCCTEMFQLWLKKEPKATWKKLMEALKAPGIEMNQLANKIEQILTSITQGNHIAMHLLTDSVSDVGRLIGLKRYKRY